MSLFDDPADIHPRVLRFVERLAAEAPSGLFNPWAQRSSLDVDPSAAAVRRRRLAMFLSIQAPAVVLVGEAPGYQGCRYTGCAFVSERLLLDGAIPRVASLHGQRLTSRGRPWSEPSATIVWRVLHGLDAAQVAVTWNAVPWHPQAHTGEHSNRAPTQGEAAAGLPFLEEMRSWWPDAIWVAVGQHARRSLAELGVDAPCVRHPANGGAQAFSRGLRALLVEHDLANGLTLQMYS